MLSNRQDLVIVGVAGVFVLLPVLGFCYLVFFVLRELCWY